MEIEIIRGGEIVAGFCGDFLKRYKKKEKRGRRRKSVEWANTLAALNGEINVDYSQRGAPVKAGPNYMRRGTGSIFVAISKVTSDLSLSLFPSCREDSHRISGFVDRGGWGPLPNIHTCGTRVYNLLLFVQLA